MARNAVGGDANAWQHTGDTEHERHGDKNGGCPESGNCGTCMARLKAGKAEMRVNNVLTPEEVAEGYVFLPGPTHGAGHDRGLRLRTKVFAAFKHLRPQG
jgi:hypothetical protein